MSDSMAVCLSDVQNDSCFPRTLGSEVEPPLSSYAFDVSVENAFMFLGMLFAALCVLILAGYGLKVWFGEYRLRYFTRINMGLLILALVDTFFWDRALSRKSEIDEYFSLLQYSSVAVIVMLCVRYRWIAPLDITKKFHEVDYEEGARYRRRNAAIKARIRMLYSSMDFKSFPPCYVNGWIPILESRKLKRGQIVGVSAQGERLSVFRGEKTGELYVLDAHCPHLGADMSVGGVVRGNCLECPFHGWLVDGRTGVFTRGPGRDPTQERPPVLANTRVRKWLSCDVNGYIYVWYHAEQKKREEPSWQMPRVEQIHDGSWLYRGRTEHTVRCHIQEIPENGADTNHLEQLHSTSVFLGLKWMDTDSWWNVMNHHWDPEWTIDPQNKHIALMKLKQKTTVCGYKFPYSDLDLDIKQIGPATVHLHIKSPHGRGILIQNITPVGPLTMKVVHQLYTEPRFKPFWANLLLKAEARMLEKNIAEKEEKNYRDMPGSSKVYHLWYTSTFFSEHSPTMPILEDKTLLF